MTSYLEFSLYSNLLGVSPSPWWFLIFHLELVSSLHMELSERRFLLESGSNWVQVPKKRCGVDEGRDRHYLRVNQESWCLLKNKKGQTF